MNRTDWKQTRLGSELELLYGRGLPASARVAGDVPVYGSNGVVGLHNKSLVEGPGIIVGRKGSVGEVAFSDGPFWPIDTTYYVSNRGENSWHFLYFLLRHLQLTGLNSHSTVPGLNRESVYSIECGFPSVPEQQRIAAVLWKIQKAVEIEAAILRNARDLKKSLLRRLFTHGLRGEPLKETEIGMLSESWGVLPLVETVDSIDYGYSISIPAAADLNGVRIVSTADITKDGKLLYDQVRKIRAPEVTLRRLALADGDVLFNWRNTQELIGKTCVFAEQSEPYILASFVLRIRCGQKMNNYFLSYMLNFFREQGVFVTLSRRAVGQANYNKNEISVLPIAVPSCDEQRQIVDILQTADRKVDVHESRKRSLQDLFKTTLHKLMTAQIRVNDLDIDTSEVKTS